LYHTNQETPYISIFEPVPGKLPAFKPNNLALSDILMSLRAKLFLVISGNLFEKENISENITKLPGKVKIPPTGIFYYAFFK